MTPNTLGAYLAMLLPLYMVDRKYAVFAWVAAIALLFTRSLGAVASVCCVLVVYLLIKRKTIGKKYLVWAGAAVLLVALVFALRSHEGRMHVLPRFSAMARLDYWSQTLQIIKQNPWVGIGPGNFNLPSSRYSHNLILQLFAENGIFGLGALAWLVMLVFVPGKLGSRPALAGYFAAAAAVFLLNNLVDFSFFLPEVSLIWWLFAGLACRP